MLIGIRGFIGAGKDTTANHLVDKHGFVKKSFADPLKDATSSIFGWQRNLLQGDTEESRAFREQIDPDWAEALGKPEFTPRLALQLMGTEAGRKVFGENIWVHAALRDAKNQNLVLSDCRFKNETQAIRDAGGIIVWVIRGPLPEWYATANLENEGQYVAGQMAQTFPHVHTSEWSLVGDRWNVLLNNDKDIDSLYKLVDLLVENWQDLNRDESYIYMMADEKPKVMKYK